MEWGENIFIGRFSYSRNNLSSYSKDNLLILGLVLVGLMVIFSYGIGNVSAASGDSIYVNSSSGSDAYDGLNSIWTSGLNGPKATIKNATGTATTNGTVHIAQGTYNENNIKINTNMTIIGEGQTNTIINGQQSGYSIFTIASGVNLTIINLTLTNATSDYGGAIYNTGTLTVENSTFTNNTASYGGGAIYNYGTLTVENSTFINNNATSDESGFGYHYGGAIYNDGGTLTVENSIFTGNTAFTQYIFGIGGAIYNYGTLTVKNSTFTENTANYGGAIRNEGILTVENSTFTENTASYGGAIRNEGILTAENSTFTNNTARSNGGMIYNDVYGTVWVNYNRIIGNNAAKGSAIYNDGEAVDARYNWWGSNSDPSVNIEGSDVTYGPWIILTITSSPATIDPNGKSIITADLLHDSNGVYHDPINGHVPDGITVNFSSDTKGNVNPINSTIINGSATTTFTGLQRGVSQISANVDAQTETTNININKLTTAITVNPVTGFKGDKVNLTATLTDTHSEVLLSGKIVKFSVDGTVIGTAVTNSKGIATYQYTLQQNSGIYTLQAEFAGDTTYAVSSNTNTLNVTNIPTAKASPTGGLYNTIKTVTLTMNEPGKIYYTINGTTPTNTSKLYTGPLTIKSTTTLKYLAVDKMGNKSKVYSSTYTIDKTAPKVATTTPTNNKTNVSRTSTIVIKFSENIKNSTYYNNIKVKNLTTGKYITITKTISGNTLSIKTSTTRSKYTWYQIIIPKAATKDYAGNNLAANYTSKFKTGK